MKCRNIFDIDIRSSEIKPHKINTTEKPIIAFDTETENGKAFLIGYQSPTNSDIIASNNPDEILEKLYTRTFRDSNNFFYNIEYDFNAILKTFPFNNIKEMAKRDVIKYEDYVIKHIPNKSFSILKKDSHNPVRFFDLAQFYNFKSLNNSAQKVLGYGKEKLEDSDIDIKNLSFDEYKENMMYQNKLKSYLKRDCEITYKLAVNLINMVKPFIVPKNFYSQASFSQQYFLENLKSNLKLPPLKILDYAMKSYQGGRFEVFKKGYLEHSYIYDIKSAYPEQNVKVPDTFNGIWKENNEYEPESLISLFKCSTEINDINISPMKYQIKNGLLFYPIGKFNDVYLNKKEYESIANLGYKVNIENAYHFFSKEPIYPYEHLKYFYELKEKLKNEGRKEESWIPKIMLNSLYGKTIQINRQKSFSSTFNGNENLTDMFEIEGKKVYEYSSFKSGLLFNPIVANEITANTRAKIFEDSKKYMNHIIGFQTDSIISDKPLSLNFGDKLGDWEIEKENVAIGILGGGVYQTLGDNPKSRYRGFKKEMNIIDMLTKNPYDTEIKTEIIRNTKLKAVMKRKVSDEEKYNEFNLIKPVIRVGSLNFDKKRIWDRDFINCQDVLNSVINSNPIII
jgi:hypothetical protein